MCAQILFMVYVYTILFILRSNMIKYVFEPPVFFLGFSLSYEFLKFPYYFGYKRPEVFAESLTLFNSYYKVADYHTTSTFLLLFQLVCIGTLLFAYASVNKRKISAFNQQLVVLKDRKIILFIVAGIIVGYIGLYFVSGGNILFLLTRRAGNAEAWSVLKSNYLVSLLSSCMLFSIPILIGIRIFSNRPWKKLFFLYVPVLVLYYLITGARGNIVYSILAMTVLLVCRGSVSVTRSALIGLMMIILFGALGFLRRSMSDTSSLFTNLQSRSEVESEWYFEITNYQLQLRDEMVFANLNRVGQLWGETYLNIVFFAVPRSIAGDLKPQFIDEVVSKKFWNRDDIGLPLNAMGEAYLNFGVGGIFVFLFMGRFMGFITNLALSRPSILFKCIVTVACFFCQTWESSYLVYTIQFLFISYWPLTSLKEHIRIPNVFQKQEGNLSFVA